MPANEATLREMLLSRDAGTENRFRIAAMAIKGRSGELVRLVANPEVQLLGNGFFATFFINGFIYFIDLEPASAFVLFDNFYLQEEGSLEILLLEGLRANEFLRGFGAWRQK